MYYQDTRKKQRLRCKEGGFVDKVISESEEHKAFFHRWTDRFWMCEASPIVGGYPGGQMSQTLGIVEYEDGTVHEVFPGEIQFTDREGAEQKEPEPPAAQPDDPPAEPTGEPKDGQPDDPPAAEKPKRKTVDTGKIMALHNAGWSNKKIADEMRLSQMTVGKYVKMLSNREGSEHETI